MSLKQFSANEMNNLSIVHMKAHYEQIFKDYDAESTDESFKLFIKKIVGEMAWNLNININLLDKDYNDPVLCSARKFGALVSLQRVLLPIAEAANYKATNHPDWSLLAGRLEIQRLKLIIPETFAEMLEMNAKVWRIDNENDYYSFCKRHSEELEALIVPERDYDLYFFGVRTLEKSYLVKNKSRFMETPQRLYLRIATFLFMPNMQMIQRYYDLMSMGFFTHASPTMFHSGIAKGSLASCFLLSIQDDLEKIFKCLGQCAMISKSAGGIGLDITNIRHSGVSYMGQSSGIVPMLKVYDSAMRYVDQGGRRKGSATIFLQPWHFDILDFLELKKQHGAEERRARDLFYSVFNCDIFMTRVRNDEEWTLFCPKYTPMLKETFGEEFTKWYLRYEKELSAVPDNEAFMRKLPARKVWNELITTQIETGMPFMVNKDTANYTSNQKNLGLIRSSNLCVAPETFILTKKGQFQIGELVNKNVDVWNGHEWSNVKVCQTSSIPTKLLTVHLSDGSFIECTPEHKFYIQNGTKLIEKQAQELLFDEKLIRLNLYNVFFSIDHSTESNFAYPFTHGFYCGFDSHENDNGNGRYLTLQNSDKELLRYLDFESIVHHYKDSIKVRLWDNMAKSFTVPLNASINDKILWFAGYADSRGVFVRKNSSEQIMISSTNFVFLYKVKLMLQTLGVHSSIDSVNSSEEPLWTLFISMGELGVLYQYGLRFRKLFYGKNFVESEEHVVKVVHVADNNIYKPTFCFTEPLRHMGVFNGILTGQCVEIVEVTDENTISSCNLASIGLDEFVDINGNKPPVYDHERLGEVVRFVVRGLNKVIDRTFYPLQVYKHGELISNGPIKDTNLRYRPLGLGVQALADTFLKMNLAWTDKEARELNKEIFATIYYNAVSESIELAKEDGVYEGFYGSPASEGLLKPDLIAAERARKKLLLGDYKAGTNEYQIEYNKLRDEFLSDSLSKRFDWQTLRNNVKKYGMRNSLLVALMPTASSAQVRYKNEAFEPFTTNMYVRSVLAGNHLIVNRYMVAELEELKLWNKSVINFIMQNEGSISKLPLDLIEESKRPQLQRLIEKCKTAFELPQKLLMDMSIDRSSYVCQSQSFNVHIKDPTFKQLTSLHFYAWENGLTTGMYYLRTAPSTEAIKFTVEGELDVKKSVICTEDVCVSCQS